jgi:hypothetical protein
MKATKVPKSNLLRDLERLRDATAAEVVAAINAIPKEVPVRDPVVIAATFGSLHLCVPGAWSDVQALEFAEDEQPCGASAGWKIRGERVGCKDGDSMVHLVVSL